MSNPPLKRAKTTKMSDCHIPEEIILQILHKLPVKSLVRFTCVSKTWLSLIKNPTFISTHLNLTISSPNKNPPLLLLRFSNNHNESYSLRYDDENFNHYRHFHLPFNTPRSYFRIVGTVNGLICLVDDATSDTIIIWNPLIQKSVTLPKPTITGYYHELSYGFGFDSRTNDYKVLRLIKLYKNKDKDNLPTEVYSLNTNSWKRIGGVPRYEIRWSERQIFVNGVLHFLAFRNVTRADLILGFDVGDEVFKEIMLPESLVNAWPPFLNVSVCDGLIAVVEQHRLGMMHVWVMEEYGMVQSWTKIFSFDRLETVLGFRKNRELFAQSSWYGIVSFQAESQKSKCFGVHGFEGFAFVDYFVESMELLDNANAVSYAIGDAPADANVENDAIVG